MQEIVQCPHCHENFGVSEASKGNGKTKNCPHCNSPVSMPSGDLEPGSNIGGFEIVKILGKGGMGNVYLAKQSSMQRLVALKTISKSHVKDKNISDLFNKEVQLSGQMNHPNIIKAIDAGETDSYYFMAITYVDGEDFEKKLDRGELIPEQAALELALKISDALKYAWEKHGLIHKDIKPGNIMLDKKGELFLMDMGIAQHMSLSRDVEKEVLGSPFYMSPEQGQGLPLGWSTDLYSLGSTLYHMIVGAPPYDDKKVTRIIEMHIANSFPEPSSRNPNAKISKQTVALLKKMLAKKPDDRFDSWDEFQKAVKDIFSGGKKKTTSLKTSGIRKPLTKPSASSSVLSVINLGLLVVIGSIIAYVIYVYNSDLKKQKSIQWAETYFQKHPYDYDETLSLYSFALETCKGSKYHAAVAKRYEELQKAAVVYKGKVENCNVKLKEARELYQKGEFESSIEVLNSIKDIEDPLKRKEIHQFIIQNQSVIDAKGKKAEGVKVNGAKTAGKKPNAKKADEEEDDE